jgi:hypothetical protein
MTTNSSADFQYASRCPSMSWAFHRSSILSGIGSGGNRALSRDRHEASAGYWPQVENKLPIQRRDRKMRRSACDRTDRLDSVS